MEPIISVRGLGKSYRIQTGERKRYRTLRDDIADLGKGLLKGQWGQATTEEFWAIKDIDFDIYPGEVVGIIGRNGAGKSTLLKVLSRVVQPTTGEAILKGRVASLLEVGTGFHPELTGRENIFMSGAVLGMKRTEIKEKFDEIVEFSEIEKFLDTPVKRYSSGMYVRLAFAVAAHLEPEILIIDEVLAVGDAAFQRKCLGKMEDVAKGMERTVLFVSHNMAAVNTLCKRGLWLNQSKLILDEKISVVTSEYILKGAQQKDKVKFKEIQPWQKFGFREVSLHNAEGISTSCFDVREPIYISLKYDLYNVIHDLEITFRVYNSSGIPIFSSNRSSNINSNLDTGRYLTKLEIPRLFLTPGSYTIDIAAHIPNVEVVDEYKSIFNFMIEETGSSMSLYQGAAFGIVFLDPEWKEEKIDTK
jgi:lipopolysaccharide transport system ATP-binding protein